MVSERTDQDRIDPGEQIPQTDLLEQQASLDPPLTDTEPTDDDRASVDRVDGAASAEPVDEGDRWEQQLPVLSADDYPHDNLDDGFEGG